VLDLMNKFKNKLRKSTARPDRGVPRSDYRRMHNPPVLRAGGEDAYSVHDVIVSALTTTMADPIEPRTYDEAIIRTVGRLGTSYQ
jgi:hypothetical protein